METEKKMIATVTYHKHDNYGAVLQCYALQQAILEMGEETEVLNYACRYVQNPFSLTALRKKGPIGYLLGIAGWCSRLPRKKSFNAFRKQYLRIGEPVTREDLSRVEDRYERFIVGSDNVWNTQITNFDRTYFLDFVSNPEKKASYAASFGVGKIPESWQPYCKELLSSFSRLGMREREGAQAIQDLLGKEAEVVLDPTMLLSGEDWADRFDLDMEAPAEKYVLVYQMVPSAHLLELAEEAARQLQCSVKVIPFPQGKWMRGKSYFKAGPEQWLRLLYHAEYIVTDSFHGTVFSILFHKRFSVFISQLGSRIQNILTLLGLENCLCGEKEALDIKRDIDYEAAEEKLAVMRGKSLCYLKRLLKR